MSQSAVALHATFTARAGHAETVRELLDGYAKLVRAEPGNVLFAASQLKFDDHSFFVYEEYANQAAFDVHLAAEYGAVFNGKLQPLITEPESALTFLDLI